MQIVNWSQDPTQQKEQLARARVNTDPMIGAKVAAVLADIKERGDAAVRDYTQKFDGVTLECFRISEAQAKAALDALSPELRRAMDIAIANLTAFHKAQRPQTITVETMPGVICEQQWRALDTVGLYVPGGTAPLFSAVLMLALPAKLAGCRRIVLCAPPQKDGKMNSETLAAAALCGVTEIFTIGGAQAIAAMAFGTAQVPKVDKILGPGNAYVTMAKQLVSQDPDGAAIDMPAGPSEVLVWGNTSARADIVAADLLAQAEHDVISQAILVCEDESFAVEVNAEIEKQATALPRRTIIEGGLANSRAIVTANSEESIAVINAYAPEHLVIYGPEARSFVPQIRTAASVFLGDFAPETAGDYASGTNHVLPTYGAARAYSGLSLYSFLKSMTVQELTPEGLTAIAPTLTCMARAEGLDAHAAAVTLRLQKMTEGQA